MFRNRHNAYLKFQTPRLTIEGGNPDGGAGGGADDDLSKLDRGDNLDPDEGDDDADAKAAAEAKAAEEAAAAAKAAEGKDKTSDEESEDDETDEERAEREAEEARQAEESAKAARKRIPLNRHEEILNKQRAEAAAKEAALARRIAELEKGREGKDPPKTDPTVEMRKQLGELQDKYEELLFDGQKDEARKVRTQMDDLREKYTDTKTAMTSAAARDAAISTLKYEQALAKVEADYPVLNPDGDTFDEAKASEVAELMQLFQTNGLTPQSALAKAVKYAMGPPAAKNKPDDEAAEALKRRRAEDARKKAAEAAAKQPPNAAGVGGDNDKGGGDLTAPNVLKMSQEAFAKLDEDALAKLRGDTL